MAAFARAACCETGVKLGVGRVSEVFMAASFVAHHTFNGVGELRGDRETCVDNGDRAEDPVVALIVPASTTRSKINRIVPKRCVFMVDLASIDLAT